MKRLQIPGFLLALTLSDFEIRPVIGDLRQNARTTPLVGVLLSVNG